MKFKSISLHNYRQYRNTEIKFPEVTGDKHFVVIEGPNGAGKTNIFNAITWCLYGKEYDIVNKYAGKPILNEVAFREAKSDAPIVVKVVLKLDSEDGYTIIIERLSRFIRKAGKPHKEGTDGGTGEVIQVTKIPRGTRNVIVMAEPGLEVQSLFPESIANYFFFNGEKLNEYFLEHAHERIKDEVFKISQLYLFDKAFDHLNKCRDVYARELKGLNPEADRIKRLIDEEESGVKLEVKRRTALKDDYRKHKDLVKLYDEQLRNSTIPNVKLLAKERDRLNSDLPAFESDLKSAKREHLSFLVSVLPSVFCIEAIRYFKKAIETVSERGEIPPDYKQEFIEGLLSRKVCICGSKLEGVTEAHLRELLDSNKRLDSISIEVIEEKVRLLNLINKSKGIDTRVIDLTKKIARAEAQVDKIDKRLKELSGMLQEVNTEEYDQVESLRRIALDKREQLGMESGICESKIEAASKRLEQLNSQYQKEIAKISAQSKKKEDLLFIESLIKSAHQIKAQIMEKSRKRIEKETSASFLLLIWKKKSFTGVTIDSEYNIAVLDRNKENCIGTLSAGERQVLALSFLSALNKVAGLGVPIVIDTPLGRISGEPKKNIAEMFTTYMKDKQILMLATDEEYTPEVRRCLQPAVGKEYAIKFIEKELGNEAEVINYER